MHEVCVNDKQLVTHKQKPWPIVGSFESWH